MTSNDAESWYDGLEFAWDKRFSHGLQFQAAYTFSNSEDTTSEATFVGAGDTNQNGPNAQYARAKSRFHTPHRFTFNGSYRLPFFANERGFLGQAFGGWMISGVVKLISGTPFSVTATARRSGIRRLLPKRARCCSIRRSSVRTSADPRHSRSRRCRARRSGRSNFGDTRRDLVVRAMRSTPTASRTSIWRLSKTFQMPWSGT